MQRTNAADEIMTAQFERVVRRVKQSMRYEGSHDARDILHSLVVRWLQSGEWERLRSLAAHERIIGESVRRFILDRFARLRTRGERFDDDLDAVPDPTAVFDAFERAELAHWVDRRLGDLECGACDDRIRITGAQPARIATVLRLVLSGYTQRQISRRLGMSLGAVNKTATLGTRYLSRLRRLQDAASEDAPLIAARARARGREARASSRCA
jgi:hypothetical protein